MVSLFASLHKQHCSGSAALTRIKNRLKCTALENLFFGGGLSHIPSMNVCWAVKNVSNHSTLSDLGSAVWTMMKHKQNICVGGYRQSTKRKHLKFCDPVAPFPMKWHPRNECRNFILMSHHYPDLDSALNFNQSTIFWLVVNLKHFPDLGSDMSSVWNFCACYSGVISLENRQCQRDVEPFACTRASSAEFYYPILD